MQQQVGLIGDDTDGRPAMSDSDALDFLPTDDDGTASHAGTEEPAAVEAGGAEEEPTAIEACGAEESDNDSLALPSRSGSSAGEQPRRRLAQMSAADIVMRSRCRPRNKQRALRRVLELERGQEAVTSVWNAATLRVGEQLAPQASSELHAHPNSWTINGVLKNAFDSIGATATHATRVTSHANITVGVVAAAAEEAEATLCKDMLASLPPDTEWLFVAREIDGTPTDVNFGIMTDLLREIARYRFADGPEPVRLLTFREWKQLGFKTNHGVLDLFC